jgi:hypothetical protein
MNKEELIIKIEDAFNGEELLWGDWLKIKQELLDEPRE